MVTRSIVWISDNGDDLHVDNLHVYLTRDPDPDTWNSKVKWTVYLWVVKFWYQLKIQHHYRQAWFSCFSSYMGSSVDNQHQRSITKIGFISVT